MSRYDVAVRYMSAGIDDYVQRIEHHNNTAKSLQPVPNSDGVVVYESPQQLRMIAHEHELADECLQAMFTCSAIRSIAQRKALAHHCYVLARVVDRAALLVRSVSLSLREVCAMFTTRARSTSAPPGQLHALNVLATCHASNAPGLSLVAMSMQVTLRE